MRRLLCWSLLALLTVVWSGVNVFAEEAVREVATIKEFKDWVTSADWTPDGKVLAAGSYDQVRLWDAASQKTLRDLTAKLGRVRAVTFTKDGKRLIAGGYQKLVLWNVETGEAVREWKAHKGYVTALALTANGAAVASSSEDMTVRLWDLATFESKQIASNDDDPMMGVAFSPDGKWFATAAGDETRPTRKGSVRLWNAETNEVVHTLTAHDRVATSVTFSPNSKLMASTGADGKVLVSNVSDGKLVQNYEDHQRPTNQARFLPDSQRVLSAAGGRAVGRNEVHLWTVEKGETLAALEKHEAPVLGVAVTADGKRFASVSRDQTAVVWELGESTSAKELTAKALTAATQLAKAGLAAAETQDAAKPAEKAEKSDNAADATADLPRLRIGMIGLDTSHCIAFAGLLNDANASGDLANCRLLYVYPKGSPDIKSSTERVPQYTEQITKLGVEVVDSIEEMVQQVDAVLLETNDGRPHLEQVIPVLKAGKPVFIDKPISGSLTDAVAIFELARHYKTPLFSSSSLRFASGAQALRNGKIGDITGCDAYSPCSLEATHPDLFWYGIHGVETLFTVMGIGCESVSRTSTPNFDFVAGTWAGGRIGTFRGIRSGGSGYGGTAFGTKGVSEVGKFDGYKPLLVEIVKFFRSQQVPVSEQETLEIYAFMEAADESKRQGGAPVKLETVLSKARTEAAAKVKAAIEAK